MRGTKLAGAAIGAISILGLAATPCLAQTACQQQAGSDPAYYPARAQSAGIEGSATIKCHVNSEGELSSCKLLGETPAGYCFGQAALDMAPSLKLKQQPPGGIYQTTIKFTLDNPGPTKTSGQ
jgi:TonB family protein